MQIIKFWWRSLGSHHKFMWTLRRETRHSH